VSADNAAVNPGVLSLETVLERCVASCRLLLPIIPNVMVSLGRHGMLLARRGNIDSTFPTRRHQPVCQSLLHSRSDLQNTLTTCRMMVNGSVAEWLECWTQALKGPGSNRSCDAVG